MKIVAYHKNQLFIQECIFTFPKKEIDIKNLNNIYLNNSRLYSLYVSFFSCSVYSSFLLQADQSRFSQVYTSLICLSIYLFICLSVYLSISISHLFICFSTLYRYLFISSVFLIICFFSVSLNLTWLIVYLLYISIFISYLFICLSS